MKFKEYDKKYAHLKSTDADQPQSYQEAAHALVRWPGATPDSWSQDRVQYSVYEAPDHEEWQKFRVSLKGQSTRMKLLRLFLYSREHMSSADSIKTYDIYKCRVDNYLGALVRGGQLSSSLEIVR